MTAAPAEHAAVPDTDPTGLAWMPGPEAPLWSGPELSAAARRCREPAHLVTRRGGTGVGVAFGGATAQRGSAATDALRLVGVLPPLYPEWLGDRSFCETHQVRYPYIAGEMAGGIATTRMVATMAEADMLAFFGAAGLAPDRVEKAVRELSIRLAGRTNWGVNLIHSPNEPALERRVANLLLHHAVPVISASAYLSLTPAVVRCAAHGLRLDRQGRITRRTRIVAKVSRPEVAEQFLRPAPADMLSGLVAAGHLTGGEAELAAHVPVAEDITVEADSGGHTDNRPLVAMLPVILQLRDAVCRQHGYARTVRIGTAGGLGTPHAVAAAFALGAAYVLTGSVNQCTVEAGMSPQAKVMLAQAETVDVAMAPAADMFEQGITLQVLRRGTAFPARAGLLYRAYRDYPGLDDIPAALRSRLEKEIFRAPLDEIWTQTVSFWAERDPETLQRAEADPKQRMALVMRWYLGCSSRWAVDGEPARQMDYQIWCGPAMGAFNRWAAGSFLADPDARTVVQIARNLLEGAAVISRAHQVRCHGVPMPPEAFAFTPRPLS